MYPSGLNLTPLAMRLIGSFRVFTVMSHTIFIYTQFYHSVILVALQLGTPVEVIRYCVVLLTLILLEAV
jgi:hypothetical protein